MADALPREFAEALERSRHRLGRLGSHIIFFSTIGSTNDVASTIAASGEREGAVVIADEQTAGRGRRGRAWFSPPGSGLYVSVVLTPVRARVDRTRATMLLPLAAGVALAEAVDAMTALPVVLKWPNDLLVARRKLAGILAEAVATHAQGRPVLDTREHSARGLSERESASEASGGGAPRAVKSGASASASLAEARRAKAGAPRELMNVVLGYGINVGGMAYPPELGDRATSLESELGRPVDRVQLWVETLAALSRRYEDLLAGRFDAILDAWRKRAPASRGARVTWNTQEGPRAGVTDSIDEDGALLVRIGDRIERIVAGEITWL